MAQEPRTRQIADQLRQQIENGSLGPGALLPSEPELARGHGVSRQTARAALQILEQEGLVVVRPRRGRIVRSAKRMVWHLSRFELHENTGLARADVWEADIERQGHYSLRQDLEVETILPPPGIAARLGLDPEKDLCVVRHHARYINGSPGIISDDYFDEATVRGTEFTAPADTALEDILNEAGNEHKYDVDEIITRMPTPVEAKRLSLGTGQPVAEHIRTGYTANDKAVRVMVSIIPGNSLILRYVIPA
jgi:GntR family transcriptional regulator